MANILWVDNDRTFLMPCVSRLKMDGHNVINVYDVWAGENFLEKPGEVLASGEKWDLILIDVMMPVGVSREPYTAEATQKGLKTGVVFYKNNNQIIHNIGAVPVFFTMREDDSIKREIDALGVIYRHKMDCDDTAYFSTWIDEVLSQKSEGKK